MPEAAEQHARMERFFSFSNALPADSADAYQADMDLVSGSPPTQVSSPSIVIDHYSLFMRGHPQEPGAGPPTKTPPRSPPKSPPRNFLMPPREQSSSPVSPSSRPSLPKHHQQQPASGSMSPALAAVMYFDSLQPSPPDSPASPPRTQRQSPPLRQSPPQSSLNKVQSPGALDQAPFSAAPPQDGMLGIPTSQGWEFWWEDQQPLATAPAPAASARRGGETYGGSDQGGGTAERTVPDRQELGAMAQEDHAEAVQQVLSAAERVEGGSTEAFAVERVEVGVAKMLDLETLRREADIEALKREAEAESLGREAQIGAVRELELKALRREVELRALREAEIEDLKREVEARARREGEIEVLHREAEAGTMRREEETDAQRRAMELEISRLRDALEERCGKERTSHNGSVDGMPAA